MIGKIAPTPVVIVHGADDRLFPVAHARRLYDAAAEPKRLLIGEGFGHAEEGLTPAFALQVVDVLGGDGDAVIVRLFAALREIAGESHVEATGRRWAMSSTISRAVSATGSPRSPRSARSS